MKTMGGKTTAETPAPSRKASADKTTTDKLLGDIRDWPRKNKVRADFLQTTSWDDARNGFVMKVLVKKGLGHAKELEAMHGETPISNKGKSDGVRAIPLFIPLEQYMQENKGKPIPQKELVVCEANDYFPEDSLVCCIAIPPEKDPVERVIFILITRNELAIMEGLLPDLQKRLG